MVSMSVTRLPWIMKSAVLVEPRMPVTLSIWTFAGMSLGTKEFSLVSIGIWGSIWKPMRATIPAIRRMGMGFFAIFTEISVRNRPYDHELFFFALRRASP